MEKSLVHIFWFRRDLSLEDNCGLYHALVAGKPVLPLFIFDTQILDCLDDKDDARVTFIYRALEHLQAQLKAIGGGLEVRHGTPEHCFIDLLEEYVVTGVYTNRDYEPGAIQRDAGVAQLLKGSSVPFYSFKNQVLFEKSEVLNQSGQPYTVFTPYKRKWMSQLNQAPLPHYPSEDHLQQFAKQDPHKPLPPLEHLGFTPTTIPLPKQDIEIETLKNYKQRRDFPADQEGTTRLGVHLRFGTVSVRRLIAISRDLEPTWLSQLVWREFYMQILYHFPHVAQAAFRPQYDLIEWRNDPAQFEAWSQGRTGFPIVDAGMRQLVETGYMHNRVRMICASFLCKDLLIDWRWGEGFFARYLLDFEMAANNGNWQWAAGTGCDAAPYFRVFNPWTQTKKFDPDGTYIKNWVPEWGEPDYPQPIVDHDSARKLAIQTYKAAIARYEEQKT